MINVYYAFYPVCTSRIELFNIDSENVNRIGRHIVCCGIEIIITGIGKQKEIPIYATKSVAAVKAQKAVSSEAIEYLKNSSEETPLVQISNFLLQDLRKLASVFSS